MAEHWSSVMLARVVLEVRECGFAFAGALGGSSATSKLRLWSVPGNILTFECK